MKKYMVVSLALMFLVFFLPWLTAPSSGASLLPSDRSDPPIAAPNSENIPPSTDFSPAPEILPTGELDASVLITVLMGQEVVSMDLGSYLVGVVRAEMPASFSLEALKAQAVAARTYTLHKILCGGNANHPHADTCTDINCCKAYMDSPTAAAMWGDRSAEYEEKILRAVSDTDGECVLYDGVPVLAVFHSSSAGMTLNAQDVWSSSVPYLISVTSPENSETVPNFHSQVSFPVATLRALLQNALPAASLSGSSYNWFSGIRQLPNGTITSLQVGGVTLSGNAFRTLLGLRSACFTISFQDDTVVFSVTGYGHGVGMSQYGANVLAESGLTYREILAWYYTDTYVEQYTSPSLSA